MELFVILLISSAAICFVPMMCVVWFVFFADCDVSLTFNCIFGRSVSAFKGKVIWITGASSGLGEAMAYELASVGARLILSARNVERLEEVKNKCLGIKQANLECGDILVLPFDISDCDVHSEKVSEALDHFQQIDVLINNAARLQIGSCQKTSVAVEKDLFDVNYFGQTSLTRLVLNHFQENEAGQVVCIASLAAKVGAPGLASYSATKHALHGFYDALRTECYRENIKVTMVCPGFFTSSLGKTAMTETKGEIHAKVVSRRGVQMPTSRCAHLTLVAAANNSYEAWISYHPGLMMMYTAQYMPDLRVFCCLNFLTKESIAESIRGRYPKRVPVWKPLLIRK